MGLLSFLFGENTSAEKQQAAQEKKNFEILKYDGIRARNMRQLPYAIKCFEQAVALEEDPETLQLLANAYMESDRLPEARTTLERLSGKTPDDIKVWLSLAHLCYMQADYSAMDSYGQKAIQLDDKHAAAYYLAGKAAYALHNELQAIVMLTKSILFDENELSAYLLRAEVLWSMRQAKDALEDIEKILAQAPEQEDALLLKAQIELATGNATEAVASLKRVVEANPFQEKAYLLQAEAYVQQNQLDEAVNLLGEALEVMPQSALLYQERGRIYLLKGEKEKSVEDVKKAIELNPEGEKQISGNYDNFSEQTQGPGIY